MVKKGDFLAEVEARYIAGEFRVGAIGFDPSSPESSGTGHSLVGAYDELRDKFVRALPSQMYAPLP